MTNGQGPGPTSSRPGAESTAGLKESFNDEAQGARRAFEETAADLTDKASALAGEAGQALAGKAEGAKAGLSEQLKAFGDAMRAAADNLAEGQPTASRLVSEAASGLDGLSASLENKSFGEVADELRSMGRNNAGGLLAGSVIAGLALGRFLRSAEPQGASRQSAASDRQGGSPTQGDGGGFPSAGGTAGLASEPSIGSAGRPGAGMAGGAGSGMVGGAGAGMAGGPADDFGGAR